MKRWQKITGVTLTGVWIAVHLSVWIDTALFQKFNLNSCCGERTEASFSRLSDAVVSRFSWYEALSIADCVVIVLPVGCLWRKSAGP